MKNIYLLIISFSLISCYTYKVKTESEEKPKEARKPQVRVDEVAGKMAAARANMEPQSPRNAKTNNRDITQSPGRPQNVEEKLEANKYFKIEVGGKPYKIQVDKWESDTLVAHVIHKPKKILKFHKNQIDQSTIAERRFSNPTADIITVVAYAAVGVGIYMLVR